MNTQGARDPIADSTSSSEIVNKKEITDQERIRALIEAELRYVGGGECGPVW
jgi:hypothetical protein